MIKHFVIAVYDGITCLLVAVILLMGWPAIAFAYIDPSVMTYTIQAVAGVAVALSAVVGVAFRRGRSALMRLLDIDPNARRIYEPEVHRISYDEALDSEQKNEQKCEKSVTPFIEVTELGKAKQTARTIVSVESIESIEAIKSTEVTKSVEGIDDNQTESAERDDKAEGNSSKNAKRKNRSFVDKRAYKPQAKTRLLYGFIAAFFFVFTIFFAAPIEIVEGSASSLVYGAGEVWWVLLAPGIGMIIFITGILTLLRGRLFNVGLVVVFAVGLCAYIQGLILNIGLPAADGATIYWGDYMTMQVVSSIVWVAIILGFIVASIHNRHRIQGVVALLSVCFVIVQGVGLISFALPESPAPTSTMDNPQDIPDDPESRKATEAETVMTEEGLFTVSPTSNVIVFVLDTFDDAYLKRIQKMDPHLLDEFTGFTSYENCTGSMIPTRFAIPQMLTGQMPREGEDFSTYKEERYQRGTFLDQINDAGYSVGLYTDSLTISELPESQQRSLAKKTVNMHELPSGSLDYTGTLYSLYQMALYRDVLWPFKWAFWYYTDQINNSFVAYDPAAPPEETIYVMDDIRYYDRLREFGLTVEPFEDNGEDGEEDGTLAQNTTDGSKGAFRFIHLLGSHYPFNYDENVVDLGEDESDVFKQSRGALHIVSEYLRQLKELGLYDQATVIVTADHGYWTITEEPLEETSTPIMFVKPPESSEEAARPLVVDDKPVSQLDLQATILDAMGLDWSEYATRLEYPGYSMFSDIDPDRLRLYLTTDSLPDLTETQFREYAIKGNALDFDNWYETGRTIDAQQ